ncbi:uncharacterized protein PODANS_1_19620 [Podospora anserina S mat+]|uniref:Podospora anserina S mat+ genomic DNA chromosome 1, supercontig 4 n=2 Tax=Podospora anserina TaxID=2587412 RepID=B2AUM5_PODAN|nr:uncharacterized protein PODANS_1_19620 [Podospora anserina S mat+]CAP68098.1 unnamed protein product [Podospora anserina S mat+]CDN29881.1 Putative protein of unknown function [Podospora anserina]CDP24353.1 Putative protein of unknown function [Podospora anserina S mat+]
MGSSSSKPAATAPQTWKAPGSAGLSTELVQHLHSSPETDASRLQAIELEIQARVAAELKRLRDQESEALRAAQAKLAESTDDKTADDNSKTSYTVSKEVQALQKKLEERKRIRSQLPESLENARSGVVRCLRENDRRPLDCWREVEAFKEEVRRVEKGWVEKVVS